MSVSFQPVWLSAASTGPDSGASIAAVAPLALSWTRTPKLSCRQRKRWVSAVMGKRLQERGGDVTGPDLRARSHANVPIPKFAYFAAPSSENFGIKGTLAMSIRSSAAYGFEVPT